jgi:GDP-L-fucose synthase
MNKQTRIYIAGHNGMVGSAILRKLEKNGFENLIYRSSRELDLRNQQEVDTFFKSERPQVVIGAAARVGGILANRDHPWTFLYENLEIQNNLISAAHRHNADRFIFLGSSCIYPRHAGQPMKESSLLTGPLEPTNQWYAVAKIAGVKMIDALREQFDHNYVSLMPTNLYGPNDNFDLETSHVLPAMIRKFHEAKENGHTPVTLWGSGSPRREFLHVDDVAGAVMFVLQRNMKEGLYNIGSGSDISIRELAGLIREITGHKGEIVWDESKPDGTPRKLMDVSKMKNEGWSYSIPLDKGVRDTYQWFLENIEEIKEVKL